MNISEPFIRRPVATSLLMAAIGFVGLVSFPFLPVAPLPQVDFPTIQVNATLQGASAETMAASVAAPLERQFGQIPGVTQLTSMSALNGTSITIQFDLNRNIDSAAQDVQAAITVAGKTLPQQMSTPPTYKKVNPADSPVMMLAARSDTCRSTSSTITSTISLPSRFPRFPASPRRPSAANRSRRSAFRSIPSSLPSSGLTLEEIRSILVNATTIAAKGTVNTATNELHHRRQRSDHRRASRSTTSCSPIAMAARSGCATSARRSPPPPIVPSIGYQNNQPGILLYVYKQPGANVIDIVDKHQGDAAAADREHPSGDRCADACSTARPPFAPRSSDVEFTLGLTIALVVLVILLFLRNFWATFIPGVTVPLALLGSFASMYLLNFSLDNLSLMALTISVGFVVDDAIVVVENIHRHIEDGETPYRGGAQRLARDRLYRAVDQLLADRGVHPAAADGRHHRAAVPRIRPDRHGFDRGVGPGFADARADAVLALHARPTPTSRGGFIASSKAASMRMLSFYQRTLDMVLRHQPLTLATFFATHGAHRRDARLLSPKGFFPIQDIGLINGISEGAAGHLA